MNTLEILAEAKGKFETEGWWRGPEAGLASVRVSLLLGDGDWATCHCLVTAVHFHPGALSYIAEVLSVEYDGSATAIYKANDSQPATEEGRLWAIGIIDKAIALAEADSSD